MNKRLTYKVLSAMVISGIALNSASALASGKLLVWEDIKKSVGNEDATKAFEKQYDVKVDVLEMPYGGQVESLRMDGPAGTGPDVITLPHDQIGSAAIQGLLSPMKVDESIAGLYTPSTLDALTYKGTLYGLPKAVETLVMVYNKDKISQVPSTLNEALELSKKARVDGQYGMLAKWDEIYYAYGVVKGMGGDIFGKNSDGSYDAKQILLGSDGAIKAGEYIAQFYKSDVLPSGIIGDSGLNAIDSLFTSQKATMVITGPWAFEPYRSAGVNIGIAPLPKLPNGEQMSSFLGVKSNSISIYSKNKELAQKYIEFINNYDNSKVRFEKTGEVPAVAALVNDPIIKDDEGARAVAIQAQYAIPMPSIPEMNEVWGPANSALQLIATGKQSPKDALESAASSLQMQIEANHAMMGQ